MNPAHPPAEQRLAPASLPRAHYAEMFGPTTCDRIRLVDTEFVIEVEKDFATYGEKVKFGGGNGILATTCTPGPVRAGGETADGAAFCFEGVEDRARPFRCHPRASGDPGERLSLSAQPFSASYRSAHSGLKFSISSSFQRRSHFLMRFSRAMASLMSE